MKVIQMDSGELCQKIFLIVGVSILKVCDFFFFELCVYVQCTHEHPSSIFTV